MCLNIETKRGIHALLPADPLGFEPSQHIGVYIDGHGDNSRATGEHMLEVEQRWAEGPEARRLA